MRRAMLAAGMVLALSGLVHGDGLQMKDGRYVGGPVTVLDLTAKQLLTVKTKRILVLTQGQKALLKQKAGVAPSVLSVYSLKVAGTDCTCFDFNISIWFEPTQVEVPHRFLVSDAEAEKKMDGSPSNEGPGVRPNEALQLTKREYLVGRPASRASVIESRFAAERRCSAYGNGRLGSSA